MNVDRMLYLADQLENPTDPKLKNVAFDMNFFSGAVYSVAENKICGTAACIGGHACILFGKSISGPEAQDVLGLTRDQMMKLFFNQQGYIHPEKTLFDITKAEAIEAILRMVNEQIDADWAKAEEAEKSELALDEAELLREPALAGV